MTNATNPGGVSSKEESAPSIETSKKSGQRLRLLCVPTRLPKAKLPKTEEYQETDPDIKQELKDYFWKQRFKKKSIRRKRER